MPRLLLLRPVTATEPVALGALGLSRGQIETFGATCLQAQNVVYDTDTNSFANKTGATTTTTTTITKNTTHKQNERPRRPNEPKRDGLCIIWRDCSRADNKKGACSCKLLCCKLNDRKSISSLAGRICICICCRRHKLEPAVTRAHVAQSI